MMDYRTVSTLCPYCGCGCGIWLEVSADRLIGTLPAREHPVNRGALCVKGWNAHQFVHSEKRLTRPLVRKNGSLCETGWEEAMDAVCRGLKSARDAHGPDSIAFLASARATNEENYLLQKVARAAIGTNNVDHCARLCHSATVVGLARAFGSGAMTNSIGDLKEADAILVIGSNTTASHPLVASRIVEAARKGARLLVADPRKTQLALMADVHLRHRPGSDAALINGIMSVIVENGWQDQRFIDNRTEGFQELNGMLPACSPEKTATLTGVPAEDIARVAELYAKARSAAIVYCMGITQHTSGVANVTALANLAMLCGQVGRPGAGLFPLRGQNNVQGACDMGCLPDVFPGYREVSFDENRKKLEATWHANLSGSPGLMLPQMLQGLGTGKVSAMYIMGENPVQSDPDSGSVKKALMAASFLVVQDIFLTPTAQLAHVVLPAASFAEKDGTFTNTERRVQRLRKAVSPPGEARPDWEILLDLSCRLGYPMAYPSPEAVMAEIAATTPIYGGIDYGRLDAGGLQWPCPDAAHPGTPILHTDRFSRGLGRFFPADFRGPAETIGSEFPTWLTTGRTHVHYHTGTMSRTSPFLDAEMPEGFAEIHPEDARRLGVRSGDRIRVTSRRGEIVAKAKVTGRVPDGLIFIPFHFLESNANTLTNPAHDPEAGIPELKVCAVRIEKVKDEK